MEDMFSKHNKTEIILTEKEVTLESKKEPTDVVEKSLLRKISKVEHLGEPLEIFELSRQKKAAQARGDLAEMVEIEKKTEDFKVAMNKMRKIKDPIFKETEEMLLPEYYTKGNGEYAFEKPDFKMSYSFSGAELYKDVYPGETVRFLSELSLENKLTNQRLNLRDILPEKCVVVWRSERGSNVGSFMPIEYSKKTTILTITIGGDLNTPEGIMSLLHEIGHAHDYVKSTEEQRNFSAESYTIFNSEIEEINNGDVKNKHIEEVMRSERTAHAFVVSKIKPFLEPMNITSEELVDVFIHGMSLPTYANKAKELLSL